MNKYQEAFEVILWSDARKISNPRKHFKARDVIEQLVDRATPMKPTLVNCYEHLKECPNCKELTNRSDNYCRKCGQALDWSKDK